MKELASGFKIAGHKEKVKAYLQGETVFPVSIELDLTSRCSRDCLDCPSARAATHWDLDRPFVDRLFGILAGQATGILLTGGEPTISSLFVYTMAIAKKSGFRDIAVVTNGSRLDVPSIRQALLEHASTIRLSLYDWENASADRYTATLKGIERLRREIDASNSFLKIGVSVLTSSQHIPLLRNLVSRVVSCGAHWAYFHPRCRNWNLGRPSPEEQKGVVAEIENLKEAFSGQIDIFVSNGRYEKTGIAFSGYHAAHFLLIVGADKKNYLGAEVKYHPDHVIADLGNGLRSDFLWTRERLGRIASYTHRNYPAIGSRHRGVLYNDFIDRLMRDDPRAWELFDSSPQFGFPHIL